MNDLYLGSREKILLNYATLIWGGLQWWDIIDRYVIKKFWKPNEATASPILSENRDGSSATRAETGTVPAAAAA